MIFDSPDACMLIRSKVFARSLEATNGTFVVMNDVDSIATCFHTRIHLLEAWLDNYGTMCITAVIRKRSRAYCTRFATMSRPGMY